MVSVVWETSFVAVSIALGEPAEAVVGSLADPKPARELLSALEAPDRRTRAKALAGAIAPVVMDLERAEVTWAP
jgi:hypothetical protein